MNILTVILIIALAIWAIYTYKACQEQKTPVNTTPTEVIDDDEAEPDTLDLAIDDEEDSSDEIDPAPGTVDLDEMEPDESDEDTDESDTDATTDSATSESGDYLIVVGAFMSREGAERVVKRLNQLGFGADRRVFLSSDYHSVIVGNYEDLNEAFRDTKKIKDAGYPDAYAHKIRVPKKKK